MRQALLAVFLFTVFVPAGPIQADPGPVDQYGGHECTHQCEEVWDLGYNEYHFHTIPEQPHHFRGESRSSLIAMLEPTEPTLETPTTFLEQNELIQNPALDVSYCLDANVFAQGWYDVNGNVRVAPVCEAFTPAILPTGYATLPQGDGSLHTKAYQWRRDFENHAYFSDMIPLSELEGMVVQGHTDMAQYVVVPKNGTYVLKYVKDGKISKMKDNVIRLDDSVVYSYPISR